MALVALSKRRIGNHRFQLSDVGVYTVKNGKIVREEFLPGSNTKDSIG